jgi:CxxC motif-containing protein
MKLETELSMREMICITCPLGCHLSIERLAEEEISVMGNRCSRGEQYAREELLNPRRVVTTTCGIQSLPKAGRSSAPRRVPLRTLSAFPKELIPELLLRLKELRLDLPVERGQLVLADALGTGIDVVVTRTMG